MLAFPKRVNKCKIRAKLAESKALHFSGRDEAPQPIQTSHPCKRALPIIFSYIKYYATAVVAFIFFI